MRINYDSEGMIRGSLVKNELQYQSEPQRAPSIEGNFIPKRQPKGFITIVEAREEPRNNYSNNLDQPEADTQLKKKSQSNSPNVYPPRNMNELRQQVRNEEMKNFIDNNPLNPPYMNSIPQRVENIHAQSNPFRDVTRGILQQIFYEHRILMESLIQIAYTFQFLNKDMSPEQIYRIFDLKLTDFRLELRTQLIDLVKKNLIKNLSEEFQDKSQFLEKAGKTYELVRRQVNQELKNGIGSVKDIREELFKEDQILTAEEDVFNLESEIATHRLGRDYQGARNLNAPDEQMVQEVQVAESNRTSVYDLSSQGKDDLNQMKVGDVREDAPAEYMTPKIQVHGLDGDFQRVENIGEYSSMDIYKNLNKGMNGIQISDGNRDLNQLEKQIHPLTSNQTLTPIQNARAESARKSYASRNSRNSRELLQSRPSERANPANNPTREKLITYLQPDLLAKKLSIASEQQRTLRSPDRQSRGTIDLTSPDKCSIFKTGSSVSTQRTKKSQIRSPMQLYSLSPESRRSKKSKREQYSTERRRIHYSPQNGKKQLIEDTVRNMSGVIVQQYFTGVPQCNFNIIWICFN